MIKNKVREWKEAKFLSETDSPYASPCILLTKSDGSNRLLVDYRKLNKNTIRMHFPLLNLDDSLEDLQGATIFAVLDLAQGNLQIPLERRAIFRLMNAPFYFAKLMKKMFGPYGNSLALHYFDDILVYARSWEELLQKLAKFLSLLEDAGLTLNIKKCRFGLEGVEYLGYRICNGGMNPGDKKVCAIVEFPTPKNVADASSFHGLVSLFRKFIPGFGSLCTPIIELFKKDAKFVWQEQQNRAFQEIKPLIGASPILAYYNPKSTRTELHTDASAIGLGAMLFQEDDEKVLRLVYAISRQTSDVERSYHSSKLELMAIVWAMERLRPFWIGIPFTVVTDCQALVHINTHKTSRILKISSFGSALKRQSSI